MAEINKGAEGINLEWSKQLKFMDLGDNFSSPRLLYKPDYAGYWLSLDTWPKDTAILLLHNICPRILLYSSLADIINRMEEPGDLKKSLLLVFHALESAILAGSINYITADKPYFYSDQPPFIHLYPKDFIQWAGSKGFIEIPEPLKVLLSQENTPAKNIFKQTNDYWTFYYIGMQKKIKGIKNQAGFKYIQCLLQNPYRKFEALDLDNAVIGYADPATAGHRLQDDPAATSGLGHGSKFSASSRSLKNRLNELQQQLEAEVKDPRKQLEAQDTQQEIRLIEEELQERNTDEKKRGTRINKAINRALETIAKKSTQNDSALYLHLKNSVSTTWPVCYTPEKETPWDT